MLSSHLCLGILSSLFPSDFLTKLLYASLNPSMHAICPAYHDLLDLNTLTVFSEVYKL